MIYTSRILYFDISAIIVILVLIFSTFFRKMTSGRTNKFFLIIMFGSLFCTIMDLCSALPTYIEFPDSLMVLAFSFSFLYYLGLDFLLVCFFLFLASSVGYWHVFKKDKVLQSMIIIPALVELVLLLSNPFTKWIFYFDSSPVAYQRGPLQILLYIMYSINVLTSIIFLLKSRKFIPKDQCLSLMFIYIANVIAMVIQMIIPMYLVQCFAFAMALSLVPITVNRPEMADMTFGVKNNNAFILEMKRAYATKRDLNILILEIENKDSVCMNLGQENYDAFLKERLDSLRFSCEKNKVYCDIYLLENSLFAVVFDNDFEERVIEIGNYVKGYLDNIKEYNETEIIVKSKVCFINTTNDIADVEVLLNFAKSMDDFVPVSDSVVLMKDIRISKDFILRNNLDDIINEAILNNEFEMYYQPLYNTYTNKFDSAEALIRLKSEKYGMISPGLFIPKAESSGKIHAIGDFVIEDVMKFIASDEFKDLGLKYIEINLSMAQLLEYDLPDKIKDLLDKYKVEANKLNIEITETYEEVDSIVDENIHRLYGMGCHFSLDDYGTGYSNIKRVGCLPLDIVKLDKTFVDEVEYRQMLLVIKNTINMLKQMHKQIVVEGIETKENYELFKSLGCDVIQGYYFSKPLPKELFIAFLKENNK